MAPDSKQLNPHLTLARLKSRVDLNPLVDRFRQYDQMDGT
jgi:2'-5' RNA ligase